MGFKISDAGLNLIKKWEGLRLNAYKCAAGVWTIGYGHTGGVYSGMKISKAQADQFLRQDCEKFENYVNNKSYVPITDSLNQNQFDALVSFAFNCGQGNLKTLCAGRSAAQIAEKFTAYNKAGGRVLSGLTQRRNEEKTLFLKKGASSAKPTSTPEKSSTSANQKVKDFQIAANKDNLVKPKLSEDGIMGMKTKDAISKVLLKAKKDDKGNYVVGSKGELVKFAQKAVGVKADGLFGKGTRDSVIAYQKKKKLSGDGIVGPKTVLEMVK